MHEDLTQLGVGFLATIIILREILNFLKGFYSKEKDTNKALVEQAVLTLNNINNRLSVIETKLDTMSDVADKVHDLEGKIIRLETLSVSPLSTNGKNS